MVIRVNEITEAIKKAGVSNARAVPMPGQSINGQHQIEIRDGNSWTTIATGIGKRMAEDLISQSANRVILG